MPLLLPQNPSIEELKEIEDYVNFHRKIKDEEEGIYQDKEQLREGLIIFKHQKKKVKNWYLRMYIGNRKYKTTSLKTQNYRQAKEIAFDEYDKLSQTLRDKGSVFEKTNEEYLQDYLVFLDKELEKKNNITSKKTIDAKKTSLKKLKTLLLPYLKPSNINPDFLEDYLLWRRKINVEGGNWNKKHKKNPSPPTDFTCYKEISDFKGFFNFLKKENVTHKDINFPQIKTDIKRLQTKNVPYSNEDYRTIYRWMLEWMNKKYTMVGDKKRKELEAAGVPEEKIVKKIGLSKKGAKSKFYKKVFYNLFLILANSGLRISSLLKLTWQDVVVKGSKSGKVKLNPDGTITQSQIAIISVPVDTKTGFRRLPTPTGKWFNNLKKLYVDETGSKLNKTDYIFQNVGTDNSKGNKFVGNPLSQSFILRTFYEMIDELEYYKGITFDDNYTLHSLRSFYINKKLELGVPVAVVARASGNNLRTIIRHYENLQAIDFTEELIKQKRFELSDDEFLTMEDENYYSVKKQLNPDR